MSHWYEVELTARKTILVEIDENSKINPIDEAATEARIEGFAFCNDVDVDSVTKLDEEPSNSMKSLYDEIAYI